VDAPLELVTYRGALPDHLRWQAVSFMRVVWPWIDGGLLREPYDRALRPVHFALVQGDLLISYAATIELDLKHAGARYRMAGLGNVFTFPSFRERGHGGRVVAAATEAIRAGAADVAALFCGERRVGFYARHGWQRVAVLPEDGGARMMLFVSPRGVEARPAFEREPFRVAHEW
jgi:GNAT superfamily N-acetyltransferase